MEVDHIFICTERGAPEAEALKMFGLSEGSSNVHPGQGTANRRFFFNNIMLELLWLGNPEEAQTVLTKPTGLFERCSMTNKRISPFGVCFRPSSRSETTAPFPAWKYSPAFFTKGQSAEIGKAPLNEPLWFFIPFAKKLDLQERTEPLDHKTGFREVTAIIVSIPNLTELSIPAKVANDSLDSFSIVSGDSHLIELEFDGAANGETQDFRPSLSLVIKW